MTESQTATDLYEISGYSIVREVGRGGIATVYLAVQESLQRQVALKIMAPALTSDPNFTRRFLNEGLTVARLNHPGIVTIYDISVDGYQHYIAMEFLKGGSLKNRVRGGMPVDEVLDILYQVASALQCAHAEGVIHRDVKPENIMFRDADAGEAVLTDFGIAKTGAQQSNITRAGLVVGTPRYMSPEQAEGQGASERSDIYALGAIFHEMLTGCPPYGGQESMAVLYAHLHDPVPLLPAQHQAFQPLLEEMMAKDPEQRIPDCDALLERLEEHLADYGDDIQTDSGTHTAVRPSRKRKRGARGLRTVTSIFAWGGVVLAVAVVASSMIWEFTRTGESVDEDYDLPAGEPPEIVTPVKIDLTEDAAPAPAAATNTAPAAEGDEDTNALLQLAAKQLRQDRLSTPPDDNAMDTYNVILRMQPGNAEAERGLQRIAERYRQLTRIKLQEGRLADAEAFARSGLAAWPQHVGLKALREEIARANAPAAPQEAGYPEAIRSYISAAKAGNAAVQFQLALAFANGDGVAADAREALGWFEMAARRGHVKAKYNLGLGKLFGPDPEPGGAVKWLESAARDEYRPAYRVLGWMYTTGSGVRKSAKEAVIWSAKGTKWTRPPNPAEVAGDWQASFEAVYHDSIIKVREQKMAESGHLK